MAKGFFNRISYFIESTPNRNASTVMSESTSILADVWEITRRHISGEAQGNNQPRLDFHAPDFINEIGSMRYNLEDLSGI